MLPAGRWNGPRHPSAGNFLFRAANAYIGEKVNFDWIMAIVRSVEHMRDNAHEPCTRDAELTVYYDGSYPLCSAEIAGC